jgi:ArsR family transcriptional regulator
MDDQIQGVADVFQALADGTRLRILGLLASGEVCVCQIHAALGLSQPKVSRHLSYLRRAGLVATRREGLWVHYRLSQPASPLVATMLERIVEALGHVEAIARDARQLEMQAGCNIPSGASRVQRPLPLHR